MTTDHDALLAAILAQPEEDTPRLVYADWCAENGQPERAEFIRVQVELARIGNRDCEFIELGQNKPCAYSDCFKPILCSSCGLHRRIQELWEIGTLGGGFLEIPAHWGIPYWRRGFIESTKLSWSDWSAHSAAILKNHPIERVRLTTPMGLGENSVRAWKIIDANRKTIATAEFNSSQSFRYETDLEIVGATKTIVIDSKWSRIEFELPPVIVDLHAAVTANLSRSIAQEFDRVMYGDPDVGIPRGVLTANELRRRR